MFRPDAIMGEVGISLVLVISAILGVRLGKKWLESLKSAFIHNSVTLGIILSGFYYLYAAVN